MDIILSAAKEGASLYAVTDPAASHIACGRSSARTPLPPSVPCSIRRPTRCSPVTPPMSPHWLGHRRFWPTRPRCRRLLWQRAVQLCCSRAVPRRAGQRQRAAGSDGSAHSPGLTVLANSNAKLENPASKQTRGGDAANACTSALFASNNYAGKPGRNVSVIHAADLPPPRAALAPARARSLPA